MIRKLLTATLIAGLLAGCATCMPTPEQRAATSALGPDAVRAVKAPGS